MLVLLVPRVRLLQLEVCVQCPSYFISGKGIYPFITILELVLALIIHCRR